MKAQSIVFALAGAFFGLIVGWILGAQQVAPARQPVQAAATAQPSQQGATTAAPKAVDEGQVQALRTTAERDPRNEQARVELANLYFDAERYDEATRWYEQALAINPKDVNASTDLAVSYYYLNQTDRALKQFDYSLNVDPRHAKTLLNQGIVLAFGKQDLQGAAASWQKVIDVAPGTPEAQAAKRALDSLRSAHPGVGAAAPSEGKK